MHRFTATLLWVGCFDGGKREHVYRIFLGEHHGTDGCNGVNWCRGLVESPTQKSFYESVILVWCGIMVIGIRHLCNTDVPSFSGPQCTLTR